MSRRLAGLLLALALAGCAAAPDGAERLALDSRTYGFVDELGRPGAGAAQRVEGTLLLPSAPSSEAAPPLPAVVLLHSSIGQGSQDWLYARELTARGFAVLAVDSFGPRGVEKTVEDQTLVGTASMLADAYAALARLAADPRVDPERIAVLGFSKGGIAALYAALETVRRRAAPDRAGGAPRFAAHVAYYPWCGVRFRDPRTTGAPVLLHLGGRDEVAPAALCEELVAALRAADPAARIEVELHPSARHAFDHPLLDWIGTIPVSGSVPVDCRFEEVGPGRFREARSGRPATAASLPELFAGCGRTHLLAGGDPQAAERALARTLAFLEAALAPR